MTMETNDNNGKKWQKTLGDDREQMIIDEINVWKNIII